MSWVTSFLLPSMKGDFNIEESMSSEILNYAISQGIIDLSHIQDAVNMNKRKEILEQHPYSIWESKDSKWHTYLPDEEKGRVPRKRGTRREIEDLIVQFYENQTNYKFSHWWQLFKERQRRFGLCNNSLQKYDSDYRRFFQDTDFESMDIRDITEDDITEFMITTIKELNLKEKAAKGMIGYISGTFKRARIKRVIRENPCDYVEQKDFLKFCDTSEKSPEQRTVSKEELKKILTILQEDKINKPEYIQVYAVELAIYTGMRIGELPALKWEDIIEGEDNGCIIIRRSEKYDRVEKRYYIDKTKTRKQRMFPLSEDTRRVLGQIKKVSMKYGFLGEYIFMNKDGKIHATSIDHCLRYRCRKLGIPEKSIHAIRRTLNSTLRTAGVSSVVAASLLGHTEQVNKNNYTYDVSDMEYKHNVVSKLYQVM